MTIIGCLGGLVLSHSRIGEWGDVIIGVLFSALIYLIIHTPQESRSDRATKRGTVATRFAAFSFTLYLVHLPLLVFVRAGTQHHGMTLWQPTIVHIGAAVFIAAAVVAAAFGFSLVTESHTERARSWVARTLQGPSIAPLK